MARIDHENLPPKDRFAFYLNVYNATVIKAVVERYADGWTVGADGFSVFSEDLVHLADGVTSLDKLEKTLTWNAFEDPRMHVGFVCGAVSCPPILPHAYTGENLDASLDGSMRLWIVESDRNRVDIANKTLHLSQIFDWYARDFGGKDRVPSYIDRWHPADVADFSVTFIPYDWALNITP